MSVRKRYFLVSFSGVFAMNHEDVPFIDQEAVRRVSVTVHNDFAYPDNSSRDPLAPQGVDLTYQGDAPRDLPTKVSVTQQPLGVESSSEDVSLVDHSRNDPAVHELAAQGVLTPLRDVPPLTHSHLGSIHNPSKTFSSSPPEVAARRMLFHSDNQRSNSIDGTTTSTSESVTLLVEEVFTAARPQQQSPDDTFSTASSTASEQEFTASTPVKERREAMPIPFSPIRRQDETEVLVRPKVRKASVEGDDDGGALNRERSGTAELSVITTEKETPKGSLVIVILSTFSNF